MLLSPCPTLKRVPDGFSRKKNGKKQTHAADKINKDKNVYTYLG